MERAVKRTNIMLSDDQHKRLKRYAQREGRTLGGIELNEIDFREILESIISPLKRLINRLYPSKIIKKRTKETVYLFTAKKVLILGFVRIRVAKA